MRNFLLIGFMMWAGGSWCHAENMAFFYALEADGRALEEQAIAPGRSIAAGSRTIRRIQIGPHTVYMMAMGSGAVETALSAQAVLTRFRCDRAFSMGPAGALGPELTPDTWHRVDRVVAWQRNPEPIKLVPTEPPAGLARTPLDTTSRVAMASGEAFIATTPQRERLYAESGAPCVDMNSYGVLAACLDHGVPLIIWKVISDRADEQAGADFRAFVDRYQGEGGAALAELIKAWPAGTADPDSYPAIRKLLRQD